MRRRRGPTAYRTCDARWPSGAAATRPRLGAGCTSTPRDSTPWSAPRPNGLDKPWTLVAAELDDPPPASYDDPGGPGRPTDARGRTATRPEEGLRPGPVGETGRRPITAGGPCLWAGGADPSVLASAHLRPATSGPGMPGSVLRRVGHGSNRSDQYGRVCGTPAINSPCCSDANHDTHPPQPRPPPVAAGLRRLFAGWAADPLTLSASRTTLAPAEAPRGRADEDVRADG